MKLSFYRDIDPAERLRLWIVFSVALIVIALESVMFQTIVYVTNYLSAMQVLSIALLGIAFGGIVSFFVNKFDTDKALTVLLTLFPLAVVGSFLVIIKLSHMPILMMALLTTSYAIASTVISLMFNKLKPSVVYMFDLVGAGLGAFVVVLSIPLLREEGSFLLLGALGSVPLFLLWRVRRAGGGARHVQVIAVLLLVANLAGLVLHLTADPFNMVFTATADKETHPRKIFHYMNEGKFDLLYSRGSLIERIDITRKKGSSRLHSCYNGRLVDTITPNRIKSHGQLDNRFPTRLKLGQDPDTLLVGPSGQGLCKAVQTLGDGHIDAVEINGAIAGLMMNELYKRSGRAYEGMDLTVGDVRTFMETTDRKYDFITLLNTHRIWSIGHTGAPEYCHTLEAMHAYLDHLKDDGIVIFEERNINDQADLGIRRILLTAMQAMKERGIENPGDHIGIFELWHHCQKRRWDAGRCPRHERFTFLMFKASPITQEERDHLFEWADMLAARKKVKGNYFRGIEWMYLPQDQGDNAWTRLIKSGDIYAEDDANEDEHNLTVVTDDIPYPFDIFKSRVPQWEILENTVILALIMVLIPGVITFAARRKKDKKDDKPGRPGLNLLLIGFFAAIGIGYLLIETVLIQQFAIFLSSPVYTLVIVLGTMLLASGIGGHFSAGISKNRALVAIVAIAALAAVAYFAYAPILSALMSLPFALRVLAAIIMIAPLGFLMGVPFPYAASIAKAELTDRHAGLFFGINGAVGAISAPLAMMLSLLYGFGITILIGGAAYALCLLLLLPMALKKSAG